MGYFQNQIRFEFYKRKNGKNEFQEWYNTLPIKDRARLLSIITKTEARGLLVAQRMKWVKKLDKNLYELRCHAASNSYRAIYFHVIENRYIITHGFTKKTQKTPQQEISHAKKIRKEFIDNEN